MPQYVLLVDNKAFVKQLNVKLAKHYYITGWKIKNLEFKDMNNERYRYWREVQRTQLGLSANLYMVFASAILGYVVNFLVTKRVEVGCSAKAILTISISFLLLSLIFYGWFTYNRLTDFRKTSQLINKGKSERTVSILTCKLGNCTWYLYYFQLLWLILGFIFSLIGIGVFIYS